MASTNSSISSASATRPALIKARDVRKLFGKSAAVDGVSFSVAPGECFGLLGPNGAGKSTLISMLYGVTRRTSGDLSVFGLDPAIENEARAIKRRTGVVTQDNALDEGLSVRENMEIYAAFVEHKASERGRRVRELLEFLNLAHKENEPIRFLSGGMKRRLVFVRALLNNPELVILDEPTTGLDPAVRHLLWGKVNELKREGKTILLTTHYMHEAEILCDRLVIMNGGKVIAEGSPAALRDQHAPGYVAVFDRGRNTVGDREASGGHDDGGHVGDLRAAAEDLRYQVSEDSSGLYVRAPDLEALLAFQRQNKCSAVQLRPAHLEDVFLKLTGQELNADA